MDGLDDWFEYALDLPPAERATAIATLRAQDPALAGRLEAMLAECVSNPDFACQAAVQAGASEPPRVLGVTLTVPDVAAAARWYADLLRCPIDQPTPQSAMLRLPHLALHFVQGEASALRLLVQHPDVVRMGAATRLPGTARELAIVDPWGNALTLRSD